MVAIDTILGSAVNPGATITAVSFASGSSGAVRNFAPGDYCRLERMWRRGASSGIIQVKSPRMHDNVRGLQFITAETPAVLLLPRNQGQRVYATDTLAIGVSGGTAETDVVALAMYYSNLDGANGKYASWSDIAGKIVNLVVVEVDITTPATIGTWQDAALNATEDLLIANTYYAVLGYLTDVAVGGVALYGTDTGNLRVGGPGTTQTYATDEYFIQWSEREGTPHIPVFQSNNKAATFASAFDSAASTAVKTQWILAQLSGNI